MSDSKKGMNTVLLHGMHAKTTVGVLEWEKKQPQVVVVDLDISVPYTVEAFEKDQLQGTVDYTAITDDIREWLQSHRCELLEYLAERLVERVFERYSVLAIKVALTKPGIIPGVDRVTVCIERHRNPV